MPKKPPFTKVPAYRDPVRRESMHKDLEHRDPAYRDPVHKELERRAPVFDGSNFVKFNVSKKTINILNYLNSNGLSVERILRLEEESGLHYLRVTFANAGMNVIDYLRRNPGEKLFVLKGIAELMGKMHSFSVAHNDCGLINFAILDRKLTMFDFEHAVYKRIDWSDASSILKEFANDLNRLRENMNSVNLSPEERAGVWDILLEQYPAPENIKAFLKSVFVHD